MDANSHFCTKCGKAVTPAGTVTGAAASAAPSYTPPPAPTQANYTPGQPTAGGSNVLKIVLIVIGVFFLIGLMSIAGLVYTAHRIKSRIHASQDGRNSSVDFGGFKASTNNTSARELARKIGVDFYPGATQQGDSSEATFGKMSTATIRLTTNDSVDKVASFYKTRYPNAMMSTDGPKFSLVGSDKGGTLTITAEESGGETAIDISKVSGVSIDVQNH